MKFARNDWGWSLRGMYWWLRWGWAWRYQEWGIVAHDWQSEERRAKIGPVCWSRGHRPYCQYCVERGLLSLHGSDDCAWRAWRGWKREPARNEGHPVGVEPGKE